MPFSSGISRRLRISGFLFAIGLAASLGVEEASAQETDGRSLIVAGENEQSLGFDGFINQIVGARLLYVNGYYGERTVIANVEAGHVWGGHDVFDRTNGLNSQFQPLPAPATIRVNGTPDPVTAPHLGEYDYHATMVGHVLAGMLLNDAGNFFIEGMGMAPYADLWSGAIATEFDREQIGAFSTTKAAFLTPYKTFFNGSLGRKADVINSSWGYEDPAGTNEFTMIVDGLARQNSTVAMVSSAGNSGPGAVGGLGTGYNGISVGSLGGNTEPEPFLTPSDFSSSGPADFYNPETGQTIENVRATVDIAAPGEQLRLAYYGGPTGSLTEEADPQYASSTDLFFTYNQSGTSFAAPVVAGGIALLKDVAYAGGGNLVAGQPEAFDSRVIRSVLMAGATRTHGWDNGQVLLGGVITTTQSLDYETGAGRLDLDRTAGIYALGTTDLAETGGGEVTNFGWDFGSVALEGSNDYFFENPFSETVELTVSLNWFVNRSFDNSSDEAAEGSFADLNLEVWTAANGGFDSLFATSNSFYNNSEFLRILLPAGGFGFRVSFDGLVYDLTDSLVEESYAVAWSVANPVPEPSTWALLIIAAAGLAVFHRRKPAAAGETGR